MTNDNGGKAPPAMPQQQVELQPDSKWVMIIQNPDPTGPCAVALNEASELTMGEAALLVAQALPMIIHQAVDTKPKEKSRIHIPQFGRFKP